MEHHMKTGCLIIPIFSLFRPQVRRVLMFAAGTSLTLTGPLWADESERIYRSAHYLGRGDTGIATSDDADAVFYNPAGIAIGSGIYKKTVLLSPTVELSTDTKDLVRQVAIEKNTDVNVLRQHIGKNQHVGLYNYTGVVLRRAAIGGMISNQTNLLVRKSPDQSGLEEASASSILNKVAAFSLADGFFEQSLLIGSTIKFIQQDRAGIRVNVVDAQSIQHNLNEKDVVTSGSGLGVDLGMMLKTNTKSPYSLGIQVENTGGTYMHTTSDNGKAEDLPQVVNMGIAYQSATKMSNVGLFLDYRDLANKTEKDSFKQVHIGTEISLKGFFGICAGLNQGYPTFGIYADIRVLRIDVGTYTEEMGDRIGVRPDTRYYFNLTAGF